jgi:hypothetical protein
MSINSAGSVTINNLAGSGNRIVVANSGGTLISAVIGSGLAFDGTTLTATGGGSGSISGSGTSGTIALFTGATSIGNSVITQSGSTIGFTSGITDSAVTFTNSTAYSTSNNYSLTYRSTTASFGIQPIANIVFDTVGDASSQIRFVTRAGAPDYAERMRITSNGTIGFNGNSGVGDAALGKMSMGYLNSNYGWIQTWSGTPLLLNPSGNPVIIGSTSNNGTRFQVTGGGSFTSSVTASSFFESSDATIKTLVEDNYQAKGIESVVAKLYIKNGKQELGYFAQDLESILPSAVNKGSDGLLNLSYREVHTAKIAALEKEIAELKKQLKNN